MAFPRKSRELKLLQGSRQPLDLPVVELPLVTAVPSPPVWLVSESGIREWNKLAPALMERGLLTEGGLTPLGILCGVAAAIVDDIGEGRTPKAALVSQYRMLADAFGLTPLSAQRIHQPPQTSARKSHFARLREMEE